MDIAKRPHVFVGNWKMYKTIPETIEYIKELTPLVASALSNVCLAVPFTAIRAAAEAAKESNILIGAQNMSAEAEGAFTGEISAAMLKDAGAQFVILGHSERRRLYCEDDNLINRKLKMALKNNLKVILCVGETLQQREEGRDKEVLKQQLIANLVGITKEQLKDIKIAYEPVWAIGTGKTATPEIAEETHKFCRQTISSEWGEEAARGVDLLYGGSVNAENAKALIGQPDIDGLLIGGASLAVDTFYRIITYY